MTPMTDHCFAQQAEVDVEAAGVGGGDVLQERGVRLRVAVAGEAAMSELPGEADRGEDSTSAGQLGSGFAATTVAVCMAFPGSGAGEKVVRRMVASGGHGRTCSRRSVAG